MRYLKLSIRQPGLQFSCNLNDLVQSLGTNLEKFDFFKKSASKPQLQSFLRLISIEVRQGEKNPVECSFHQVKQRPSRSFKEEKQTQILKQLSSQLYYRFMSLENTDRSEIQVLCVFNKIRTRYLFFATNPLEKEKNFKTIKKEWEENNLGDLVTEEYQPSGVDEAERFYRAECSKRHAGKLKQRVFSSTKSDELISFIRKHNIKGRFFIKQPDSLPEDGIYFVNPYHVKSKNRYEAHAEEQLCDIVKLIRKNAVDSEWQFSIFGKKRPCSSCFGRLCYENKGKNDLLFSKHPGYLWIPALLGQDRDIQISTIKHFILSPSHVSKTSSGKLLPSRGTLSDSSLESSLDDENDNDESRYPNVEQDELLGGIENTETIPCAEDWKAYLKTIKEEEHNQSDSNSEIEELTNEIAENFSV